MNSKNELLVSIIKKSLNSFNLELIDFSEEDARFESKNKDYSLVYKIIKEENQYRLFWGFSSEFRLPTINIFEFNFKFDKELENKKLRIKVIEEILNNIQKFKIFVCKIFKSIYKGD